MNKTKAIYFGSNAYIRQLSSLAFDYIDIGNARVVFESSVKSLGVVLDSELTWKEHVTSICKRVNSLIYRLNFFRKSTTLELRKHLIKALLFPLVDYSLVLTNLSAEQELRLERGINSGIRYIYGLRRFEHVTPYRRKLRWLTISARRNYFACNFCFKLFMYHKPNFLLTHFLLNISNRPVRGEMKPLIIPNFRTETYRKSFLISSSYLWNTLPQNIRNSPTILTFKQQSFTYFFDTDRTQ